MSKERINLLFTSAGRRVSLLRHFRNTLKRLELSGVLISADMKRNAPAGFVADRREIVPSVHDPLYIPTLKDICVKHGIDILIPLIDAELGMLAQYRGEFKDLGVTVLVSCLATTKICGDKRETYSFFRNHSINTAELYSLEHVLSSEDDLFPLIVKPAKGSSADGVIKVRDLKNLEFFMSYMKDPIIQELVTGQEYTLDVLVDFKGVVRCVVPRARLEIRAGEVSKGMTVKDPELIEAARNVVSKLPNPLGCITVQCFKAESGEFKFIEINPRFGGGFPLALKAGADFPRWILEQYLGRSPIIPMDDWEDNIVMLRYDDEIFVNQTQI